MDNQEALAEPTQQQGIQILFDKAVGAHCSELTHSEAIELSRHYRIARVKRRPGARMSAKQHRCCFCVILQEENRSFEKSCHLQEHYKAHLRCRQECTICRKSFATPQTLKRHQHKIHPNTEFDHC